MAVWHLCSRQAHCLTLSESRGIQSYRVSGHPLIKIVPRLRLAWRGFSLSIPDPFLSPVAHLLTAYSCRICHANSTLPQQT